MKNRERPNRAESPCVRLCTLDRDDVCVGCHRHIDEVCAWAAAGDDERRRILERAAARGERVAGG